MQKTIVNYEVTIEKELWYRFWSNNNISHSYSEDSSVYVLTSIFAPAELKKAVAHQWKWYNSNTGNWEVTDRIQFEIMVAVKAGTRDTPTRMV